MANDRYFKACKGYEYLFDTKLTKLPHRSTKHSAGYDFYAAEECTLPSIWSSIWKLIRGKEVKPVIVHTHVKAKMRNNEVLLVFNRSSNPGKGLILANGVGVVDSDYFENKDNDGDIGFGFYNIMPFPVTIKRGQKIGQGVFTSFLKTSEDNATGSRTGGFGSTGA